MEQEKNKTFIDKIWDLFASVKFAIIIFALISLTSVVGTILEQKAEPAKNIQILSKIFGESLAPTLYNIFDKIGFMDMYHSWWFLTLLILFSANIVICSIERLPRIWKMVREPISPLTEEHLEKVSIKRELILRGKPEKVKDFVISAIKGAGFKVIESKEDKGYQLYSQKGSFTRLGVYITHSSILLILIGAFIGIFLGFKGFLPLPEGMSSPVVLLHNDSLTQTEAHEKEMILNAIWTSSGSISSSSATLGMDENTLKAKMHKYGIQPLGFTIRCDDFDVYFYGSSDLPKEYKSWLTVIDGGKEVLKKTIGVNDPLAYKSITFYQASYGMVPNAQGKFILRITPKSGAPEIKQLNLGERFIISGTTMEGTIRDFSRALSFDKQGRPITYAEMMNNPAVFIDFKEGGKEKYSGWILKRHPITAKLPEGHTVEFIDIWGVQYTGLQVRKDPGVWIVYLGCIVMSIGLFIAFFMSHRKLWVRIAEEKNSTKVIIGATTNKNRAAFERKINKIITLLSKKQEGEK
ncbi:MAG: cytochrome c biogenesis protein ResB [Nitrospirota bacterium]|nr:cytochrome c biogenesis protein ResB [Nitrospirota bacterium]MDH5768740.1 cytochrome c biogenesis protein ResB [Nitrospirota bacterium]